jgi:hypothetical protein
MEKEGMEYKRERLAREMTERNPDRDSALLSKQERLLREKALKKPMMFESVDQLMSSSTKPEAQRKRPKSGCWWRSRFGRYFGGGEGRLGLKSLAPAGPSRYPVDDGAATSGTKSTGDV